MWAMVSGVVVCDCESPRSEARGIVDVAIGQEAQSWHYGDTRHQPAQGCNRSWHLGDFDHVSSARLRSNQAQHSSSEHAPSLHHYWRYSRFYRPLPCRTRPNESAAVDLSLTSLLLSSLVTILQHATLLFDMCSAVRLEWNCHLQKRSGKQAACCP